MKFALCAHDENLDVARHWKRWHQLLTEPSTAPALRASEVVRDEEGYLEWSVWMCERCRL